TWISVAMRRLGLWGERLVHPVLLLRQEAAVETGGGRGRAAPAHIARALCLDVEARQNLLDAAVDDSPGAHVLRLLLAPHELRVAIACHRLAEHAEGERIKLLDPDQSDVGDLALAPRLQEIVIDLAAREHDAADPVIGRELI